MDHPIFYNKLIDTMLSVLIDSGISKEQAKTYAENTAFKFCRENGGDICRIPSMKSMVKQRRDSAIRGDSSKMNTKQLMKKHKVSESVVLRALR